MRMSSLILILKLLDIIDLCLMRCDMRYDKDCSQLELWSFLKTLNLHFIHRCLTSPAMHTKKKSEDLSHRIGTMQNTLVIATQCTESYLETLATV